MDSRTESPNSNGGSPSAFMGGGGSQFQGGGGGEGGSLADMEVLLLQISRGENFDKFGELAVIDFIPQCQYILVNSIHSYAQITCTKILEEIIKKQWNFLSLPQKLELKIFLLTLLESKASLYGKSSLGMVVTCLAKLYKLGWFDDDSIRDVTAVANTFMKSSSSHFALGLGILIGVTNEINDPETGLSLTTQRKYANSFRDLQLQDVFNISLNTLKNIRYSSLVTTDPDLPENVTEMLSLMALSLCVSCLSYDFIGTNCEESYEDSGTIHVPASWKAIILDPSTMQLLFEYYLASTPPRSSKALEALTLLSSVRQNIFSNETERGVFMTQLISGFSTILKGGIGLSCEENYHQFCRLLSRLKSNFRLSELTRIPEFNEFLELTCQFTLESFKVMEDNTSIVSYLLAFWSRLVSALPYVIPSASDVISPVDVINRLCGIILEGYISNLVRISDRCADPDDPIENPLDDESALRDQMDRFVILAHSQYEAVCRFMVGIFDENLALYNQPLPPQVLTAVECKLAWLTQLTASAIGPSASEVPKNEDILCDAELSRRVFQLLDVGANRIKGGSDLASVNIEKAIIAFFKSFRKGYILDGLNSVPIVNYVMTTPHRLHSRLSLGSTASSPRGSVMESALEEETISIFDAINIGDLACIMNIIIYKLCENINSIATCQDRARYEILDETLEIFVELVSSYSSSKMLLNLDSIQTIIKDHSGEKFLFLRWDSDNKYRIKFFSALMRLVFTSSEDLNNSFDVFVGPNLAMLEKLGEISDLTQDAHCSVAIIQVLRDFRGIAQATYNKRTFGLLFEALHPHYFELFVRIAEQFALNVDVCSALLKFLSEFVYNKSSRITFEQCSPNGILLFRDVSKILCTIGSELMSAPVVTDLYKEKYKIVRLILNCLVYSLSGNYIDLGGLLYYNDPALASSIQMSMEICLKIPSAHLVEYMKLAKAYYAFIELLFKNHLDLLSQLDSATFIGVLMSTLVGLESTDVAICTSCAYALDHFATYLFLNRNRPSKPTMQQLVAFLTEFSTTMNQCMHALFQVFLHSGNSPWAVTRPILSMLLADEGCFHFVQGTLVAEQITESGRRLLSDEFAKLTSEGSATTSISIGIGGGLYGVQSTTSGRLQQSLEIYNRDKFTQRLIAFKSNTRDLF